MSTLGWADTEIIILLSLSLLHAHLRSDSMAA